MGSMANIAILLQNLRDNHWHITAFQFNYNKNHYIVLFEDIGNLNLVANDYIVFLTFIDRANENRTLQVKANTLKFEVDVRKFREFFGIQYTDNLGEVFKEFYKHFNKFVPQTVNQNFDNETQIAVINRLSRNDNDNVNNICCYAAKRNGKPKGIQYHRTPFNSDKTRLLREKLYNMLGKNDDTISFCYRAENPLSDIEIYEKFTQQYGINP